jgi:CheY-like chemotaxis protein
MKILIVDDNPDITSLFSDILNSEGHTAKFVNDAKEGLDLIRNEDFSIIFLDVAMPNMSGMDVLTKLDEDGILNSKKIVLFTATPIPNSDLEFWKNKGLFGLIKKPVRLVEILEILESAK